VLGHDTPLTEGTLVRIRKSFSLVTLIHSLVSATRVDFLLARSSWLLALVCVHVETLAPGAVVAWCCCIFVVRMSPLRSFLRAHGRCDG